MKIKFYCVLLGLSISLLSACGGESTTSGPGGTIKAVVKTSALAVTRNVAGIQLSISVPAGVSPQIKTDGSVDAYATVEITSAASSGQTLPGSSYVPATASSTGKLTITGIVAPGFSTSDTITIHLNVAPGTTPVVADFRLLSFDAYDTSGAIVTGLSPVLTTSIL
jgi:hypothetical protein